MNVTRVKSEPRTRRALNRLRSACVALLATATLLGPGAGSVRGQWTTTDWSVQCSADQFENLVVSFGMPGALSACDDSQPLSPAGLVRRELRANSLWLQGLGFRAPTIERESPGGRYLAWLDDSRYLELQSYTGIIELNGRYTWGNWNSADGAIFLNPLILPAGIPTEVHEQFHAVQASHDLARFRHVASDIQWVAEGTATAVETAWTRKPGVPKVEQHYSRFFNEPLHEVPTGDNLPAYGTALFWLDVGRQLRSRDWVGYLPDVLDGLSAMHSSLAAVDRAVSRLFRDRGIDEGGLYRAYPEFVRHSLSDPDEAARWFSPVGLADLSVEGKHEATKEIPGTVGPLAADAYKIRVRVPAGLAAALRIEFEQSDSSLHLIVDRRRLNRPPSPENLHRQRNVFATTISGTGQRHEFFVRVANVDRPALVTKRQNYKLKLSLTRTSALAQVSGSENAQLDGVLFSYINPEADPQAVANEIIPALTERYADHAGLDESTEEGRQAREQIREAVGQAQPSGDLAASGPAGPAAAAKKPARCMAVITLFNDDERAVARLMWEGAGPLLDREHAVQATYAHDLHDAVYSTTKQAGQEIALIDDPEAIATWGAEFKKMTVPGALDLFRQAGGEGPTGMLGMLAQFLPLMEPREGETPQARTGQQSMGRLYDDGSGKLWMDVSAGARVRGAFRFTASGETGMVAVEGDFTAVPGPIMSNFLRSGCENLPFVDPEDDEDIIPDPAVYPPDEPDADDADDDDGELPVPIGVVPPIIPVPLIPPPCMYHPVLTAACVCLLFPELCDFDICEIFPNLKHCVEPGKIEFPDPIEQKDPVGRPPPCGTAGAPPCPVPPGGCKPPDCPPKPPPDEERKKKPPPPPTPEEDEDPKPQPEPPGAGNPRPPADPREPPDGRARPAPQDGEDGVVRALVLDFLEAAPAGSEIRSAAQPVAGTASGPNIAVVAEAFAIRIAVPEADLRRCGLPSAVEQALGALDSAPQDSRLRLETSGAAPGLDLALSFAWGDVAVDAHGPGRVRAVPISPSRIRVDVARASLTVRLNETESTCEELLDFAFVLSWDGS